MQIPAQHMEYRNGQMSCRFDKVIQQFQEI